MTFRAKPCLRALRQSERDVKMLYKRWDNPSLLRLIGQLLASGKAHHLLTSFLLSNTFTWRLIITKNFGKQIQVADHAFSHKICRICEFGETSLLILMDQIICLR